MSLRDRLRAEGPKRILALDGGGMRGAITLGYLVELEKMLQERHSRPDLRLRDYFDLIGGTSTGAVIAAALAIGMETSQIRDLYGVFGPEVFGRRQKVFKRVRSLFSSEGLEDSLRTYFGERTLGDPDITTGLCIVTKRADTRSVWPMLNNPYGKYFEANKDISLVAAVRASTAAPVVFAPEAFDVGGGETGAFVDGGVSAAKNPALLLFLIATLSGYRFNWPTGDDNLLLVSVGTGFWSDVVDVDRIMNLKVWNWAIEVPGMFLQDVSLLVELILQSFSQTPTPTLVDSEIGDLANDLLTPEPLLSYIRYDVSLDEAGLSEIGFERLASDLAGLRDMTRADKVTDMIEVGQAAARHQMIPDHLPEAFDLTG